MRKYLVDQLLFLIAWIGIMICIPLLCGPIFTFILETMVAISWGYLCRRILLLPFDLLFGKVTRSVYFASQACIDDCEFYINRHCPEWRFYYENKTLILLIPMVATMEVICKRERPKTNAKLSITYFRFSKILLGYDQV